MLKKLLKQRNKKGFTLIELIVVLVIMAILVAAAAPAMMGYVENARKGAYLANCRAVYVAAQAGITEAMANGKTVTDTSSAIDDKGTKLEDRIKGMTEMTITFVTAAPANKDEYKVTITGNSVTEVVGCYADGKTVTLTPGTGANVFDN